MNNLLDDKWADYFNRYPDKFIEMFWEIELQSYQKIMCRTIYLHSFRRLIKRYFMLCRAYKERK